MRKVAKPVVSKVTKSVGSSSANYSGGGVTGSVLRNTLINKLSNPQSRANLKNIGDKFKSQLSYQKNQVTGRIESAIIRFGNFRKKEMTHYVDEDGKRVHCYAQRDKTEGEGIGQLKQYHEVTKEVGDSVRVVQKDGEMYLTFTPTQT